MIKDLGFYPGKYISNSDKLCMDDNFKTWYPEIYGLEPATINILIFITDTRPREIQYTLWNRFCPHNETDVDSSKPYNLLSWTGLDDFAEKPRVRDGELVAPGEKLKSDSREFDIITGAITSAFLLPIPFLAKMGKTAVAHVTKKGLPTEDDESPKIKCDNKVHVLKHNARYNNDKVVNFGKHSDYFIQRKPYIQFLKGVDTKSSFFYYLIDPIIHQFLEILDKTPKVEEKCFIILFINKCKLKMDTTSGINYRWTLYYVQRKKYGKRYRINYFKKKPVPFGTRAESYKKIRRSIEQNKKFNEWLNYHEQEALPLNKIENRPSNWYYFMNQEKKFDEIIEIGGSTNTLNVKTERDALANPTYEGTAAKPPIKPYCASGGVTGKECSKLKHGSSEFCKDHTCKESGCNRLKSSKVDFCKKHKPGASGSTKGSTGSTKKRSTQKGGSKKKKK